MSDIFLEHVSEPEPDHMLGVDSTSHPHPYNAGYRAHENVPGADWSLSGSEDLGTRSAAHVGSEGDRDMSHRGQTLPDNACK
jgi:hypothetical protein